MNASKLRAAVEPLERRQLLSSTVELIAETRDVVPTEDTYDAELFHHQLNADAAGNLVYAWRSSDDRRMYVRRMTPTGGFVQDITADTSAGIKYNGASAVAANGSFIVVWETQLSGAPQHEIRARMYRPDGTPIGGEIAVAAPTNTKNRNRLNNPVSRPHVAMDDDGDAVVTWWEGGYDTDTTGNYAQRISKAAAKVGAKVRVNTYTTASNLGMAPVAMDADGDFVVTWVDFVDADIRAARFAADGTRRGADILVNASTQGRQEISHVDTAADGRFVIAWENAANGVDGVDTIYTKVYAADGTVLQPDRRIAAAQRAPAGTDNWGNLNFVSVDVAADGRYLVGYAEGVSGDVGVADLDVYAQAFEADGTLIGKVQANSTPYADCPEIAMQPNGEFVVAWQAADYNVTANPISITRYRIVAAAVPPPPTAFSLAAIDEDDVLA